MAKTLPYIDSYGNITVCLNKIIDARTPAKFSQDFLSSVLGMTGGGATPIIKYLKKLGFLSENGEPTEIYKNFRVNYTRGGAAAEALKIGYADLFKKMNTYTKKLTQKLKRQ